MHLKLISCGSVHLGYYRGTSRYPQAKNLELIQRKESKQDTKKNYTNHQESNEQRKTTKK